MMLVNLNFSLILVRFDESRVENERERQKAHEIRKIVRFFKKNLN